MISAVSIVVFLIIGFFAQFIDGTVGMGYGAFSSSILIGMGVMPALASDSIHTAEIFVSLFSGVSHLRFGNVRKDWLRLLVTISPAKAPAPGTSSPRRYLSWLA